MGLQGDYRDSCVVCLTGTDTGLAFKGEAEYAIAGLIVLGVPEHEATIMVQQVNGCDGDEVPAGTVTQAVRVCASCAARSGTGMKVALLALGIPVYERSGGVR